MREALHGSSWFASQQFPSFLWSQAIYPCCNCLARIAGHANARPRSRANFRRSARHAERFAQNALSSRHGPEIDMWKVDLAKSARRCLPSSNLTLRASLHACRSTCSPAGPDRPPPSSPAPSAEAEAAAVPELLQRGDRRGDREALRHDAQRPPGALPLPGQEQDSVWCVTGVTVSAPAARGVPRAPLCFPSRFQSCAAA